MENKNIKDRECKECGKVFKGGPRAWYCSSCREKRRIIQNREFKARKRKGDVIPLGSLIKCIDCEKEFIKMSGMHYRCEECAKKHLKEVDNAQSLEWNRNNPEKYLKAKRDFSKKRHKTENIKSGIVGITWKKDLGCWRIRYYDKTTKKQIHIGFEKDLENAKKLLNDYKKLKEKRRD